MLRGFQDAAVLLPAIRRDARAFLMRTASRVLLAACFVFAASHSSAQVPGFSVSKQFKAERLAEGHWRLTGQVEMERGEEKFFADIVDYFGAEDRIEASGNVVYVSKESRVAADRLTYNAKAGTGTFFNASGTMTLTTKVERSMFGTQEPEAYFYGERIEKVGPDKYRVHKGGFSTCVQPTPRWEITTSSTTLTVDEYAILKNAVLNVKGVPLLYVPVLYYPINDEDRSTGFLIPQYGNSRLRGQTLSNAFFWAINRSSDATVNYDWFSLAGQGLGGEYRYIAAPGSEGNFRAYMLKQNAATYDTGGTLPETRSFELRGSATQKLPGGLRARANIDYFSDITIQQTYYTNLYDASRRQRVYGGNVSGAWGAWNLSGTYNRTELFYGEDSSVTNGSAPRISFGRAQRKIGSSPVYWSFTTDYSTVLREYDVETVTTDLGLNKFEFVPQVRVPFTRWPFLQLNGVVVWRNTWYSESQDENGRRVEDPLLRQYMDLRGEVIGPTFTRVWDTPGNGYAEKFKHVVEPNFSIQRVTSFDNYDAVPKLDGSDYTYGGTTRIGYGLTQRFLARQREGGRVNSREFLNVSLTQAYYTDERATLYDPAYMSSFMAGMEPSKFTPVALQARATPAAGTNGSFRLEWDPNQDMITSLRANGTVAIKSSSVSAGWSQRKYELTDVTSVLSRSDNYLNLGANLNFREGRFGGQYLFDYDFSRDLTMQQRVMAFYNSQCCGIAVEFQKRNLPSYIAAYAVPNDARFTISFTLAGVGTFASPLGMFGGSTFGSSSGF
jgi:LPS-assembly protein